MRRLLVLGLLTLMVAPALGAQQTEVARKRPALSSEADTNDADAYYRLGHGTVHSNPSAAADAFYWATRLNPNAAHAFYGRYATLLLEDPRFLVRYLNEDKKLADSPRRKQIDSLFMRALMLDPFFFRKYEHLMIRELFRREGASDRVFAQWVQRSPPRIQALVAYCEGRFADALRYYASALPKSKQKAWLRFERARTFYLMDDNASALTELAAALEELRKRDSEDLVVAYNSKALLEFSIGRLHERMGDLDAAREAYGRALQEDLAFYPAHVELGMIALQRADTASALSELAVAIDVHPSEPMLRLFYGYLLSAIKRYSEAEAQLARAIALEPEYARSYQLLGEVYEAQQRRGEAIAHYEGYLARAARSDAPREDIVRRIETLRAQSGEKK
jgi:Tfp pilus assembly protein PilF